MMMVKDINIVVLSLALLCFANIETLNNDRNKAEKPPCFAPVVKEGETGKLTFFISHDLISSTDFSATLRRADNPVKDILVCRQGPPMNCEVNSPYLSYGTAHHSITLLIPSVTKAFADKYLLQMYANGSFQQPSVCPLVVEACDDGWYGPSCDQSCGSCLGDTPCNKTSGYCTACKPGWRLPLCQTACDDGSYGQSCMSRCGSCRGNEPCDKETGHCTKCQPGWTPPLCQNAPRLPCRARPATEGLTGKLTFYIQPNALSFDDTFVTIRRTRHPDIDILVCTRKSPIECEVNDQRYQSKGIRGHWLTLKIPNVTTDFDDIYVMQVYANGTFQYLYTCHLVVKAYERPCLAPAVTLGQTGSLVFFIRPDILSSEDFYAMLRRNNQPDKDILVCTTESPITCHVNDQRYLSTGIEDGKLTLQIPNITTDFQDTYTFQVFANGSFHIPNKCSLMVKACDDGRYGPSCQFQCGSCRGGQPCDKETGHCGDCNPGWTSPFCQKACVDGWYGPSCQFQCGSCRLNQPCDKETGHCEDCNPGWTSPSCKKACNDGWYGHRCQFRCGSCRGGQPCDKETGHCGDCNPGWTSPFCKKEAKSTVEGSLTPDDAMLAVAVILALILGVPALCFMICWITQRY